MKLFLLIFIYFIHNCSPRVSPVDSNLFGLLEYRLNQATISGKALKGEIKGAKVEAFAMNSQADCNFSAPLASSTTNEAGEYSLTLRKTGSPVCIRVSPQLSGTRVFDEKMGRDLPIETPASLNLVHIFREDMNSSSNRSTIFISPFSRMIHNRVQTLAKANPNTSVSQLTRKAGREVVIRFGLTRGLSQSRGFSSRSINEAEFPDIDEIASQFNDSGNSVGMKFLALLSAFSQLANNNKKGAQVSVDDIDSMIEAFAKDMTDGKFDGRDASGEKVLLGNGRPLGENPLSNQLLPALNQFFQEGGQIGNEPVSSQFLNSISFADATPIQSEIPISEPVLPADSITFAAAGFSGSGASAQSFLSGGLGAQSYDGLKDGGFGGGGAPANNSGLCAYSTAGGGGGYSGGGSSGAANGSTFPGGGGGSFNGGSSPLNTAGFRAGHGIVIITYTP